MIKLVVEKAGEKYLVETPMPDLRGYKGLMSVYSGLQSTVNKMLWQLAKQMDEAETQCDERNGILGAK